LNNKIIFVCSKNFVGQLQEWHQIPDKNVMSMIDSCNLSPRGIPETELDGMTGLKMFMERLTRTKPDPQFPVIIHCSLGRNRSPVAAVIYLITQHVTPARACELVTTAFKKRDTNFVLNSREHYTQVLEEAAALACGARRRRHCALN
jgi:protein-tyrosine phosphatase